MKTRSGCCPNAKKMLVRSGCLQWLFNGLSNRKKRRQNGKI